MAEIDKTPSPYPLFEMWSLYREYVRHENDLVGSRMTLFFSTESFLMLAFAWGITRQGGHGTHFISNDVLQRILTAIGIAGISVALLSFMAICGARMAVNRLRASWSELKKKHSKESALWQELPDISGGKGVAPRRLGQASVLLVPCVFVVAWLYALGNLWHMSL